MTDEEYKKSKEDLENELNKLHGEGFPFDLRYLRPAYDALSGNNLRNDLDVLRGDRWETPVYFQILNAYENLNDEKGQKYIAFGISYGYLSNHFFRLAWPFTFNDKMNFERRFFSAEMKKYKEKVISCFDMEGFNLLYSLGVALECRRIDPAYFYNSEYYLTYDRIMEIVEPLRKEKRVRTLEALELEREVEKRRERREREERKLEEFKKQRARKRTREVPRKIVGSHAGIRYPRRIFALP